jgi:catechol 2,3-dioxygenase-like lactoylglutathione lyase family enzyme
MPRVKSIEARLPVTDVDRSAAFFANTLGFRAETLWPQQNPEFAILSRDGLRLQLGRIEVSRSDSNATLWLDVEELAALHSKVQNQKSIEWGPEVDSYGRREFGFRDPDGNWVILSEVTSDPTNLRGQLIWQRRAEQCVAADRRVNAAPAER